jgi:hypothetical protein
MRTTVCDQITEQLITSLANPGQNQAGLEMVLQHITGCPHCKNKVARLMLAVMTHDEDQLTCQECEELLPDYIAAKAAGQINLPSSPLVTLHLVMCPHCSAAYISLSNLLALAYDEQLPEPRSYPVPDLSFLKPRPVEVPPQPTFEPNWLQVMLDAGQAWLERETGRWRQLWLSLPALGQNPGEAPALAGLMSAASSVTAPNQGSLTLAPANANFELSLTLTPDPTSTHPNTYRLEVDLSLTERFGDFSGADVTLWWGSSARSQKTNALGEAVFSGLPGDQLASMKLMVSLPD